ncbi:odorant receptor 131-2-like [Salarias fasciatus]|uniref:odorant receptor 131-2-like n=1 Tax=Salarias fasciatus TaxID=181472 RepID=UPI001176D7F3|nr:odorant receptor 131-2-like [Salarias fasciatus]
MNVTDADVNMTAPLDSWISLNDVVSRSTIVVILGIMINYINATMVHTFSKHYIFKTNPRYILFIHLVLNDMIQLTVVISLFLLTYIFNTIYVLLCALFILPSVLTTQNTPLNLLFMAVECYISVCIPLRYNQLCTVKRTYAVIGTIWAVSCLSVLPDMIVLLTTESQQFLLSLVICHRDTVFRSSYIRNKRDGTHIAFLVIVWLTLYYTFFRILFVAKTADVNANKARNTILLHGFQVLLCMTVYVQPMFTQFLLSLFPRQRGLVFFTVFVISQILPRFSNPIVYGVRDTTFRKYFKRYLSCGVTRHVHPQTEFKF